MEVLMCVIAIDIIILCCIRGKGVQVGLMAIVLSLSVVAFCYNPIKALSNGNYTDLYRFYNTLDLTREFGYGYLISNPDYKSLFIARIYIFLISLLKYNGFLPAITEFILYGVIFKFIYRFCKLNKSEKSILIATSIFFLITINFRSVITNIRNPMVFALYFYILYKEVVEKSNKKICFIGYIGLCFIHQVALVLLVFRILVIKYNKITGKVFNIGMLLWSSMIPVILIELSKISQNEYIGQLVGKIDLYRTYQQTIDKKLIILSSIKLVILGILLIYIKTRKNKKFLEKYRKIIDISTMVLFFSIGAFKNYNFFVRFPNLVTYFIIFYLILIYSNKNELYNSSNGESIKKEMMILWGIKILILICIIYCFIYYFFSFQYGVLCY